MLSVSLVINTVRRKKILSSEIRVAHGCGIRRTFGGIKLSLNCRTLHSYISKQHWHSDAHMRMHKFMCGKYTGSCIIQHLRYEFIIQMLRSCAVAVVCGNGHTSESLCVVCGCGPLRRLERDSSLGFNHHAHGLHTQIRRGEVQT